MFNRILLITFLTIFSCVNLYSQWTGTVTPVPDIIGSDAKKSILKLRGRTLPGFPYPSSYWSQSTSLNNSSNWGGNDPVVTTTTTGFMTRSGTFRMYELNSDNISGSFSFSNDYPWRKLDLSSGKYDKIETIGDVTRYTLITETNEDPFAETTFSMSNRLSGNSKWKLVGDDIIPIYKIHKYLGEKRTEIIDGVQVEKDIIRYEIFVRNVSIQEFLLGQLNDDAVDIDPLTTINDHANYSERNAIVSWHFPYDPSDSGGWVESGESATSTSMSTNGQLNISTSTNISNTFIPELGYSINLSSPRGIINEGDLTLNYSYTYLSDSSASGTDWAGIYGQEDYETGSTPPLSRSQNIPISSHKVYFNSSLSTIALLADGEISFYPIPYSSSGYNSYDQEGGHRIPFSNEEVHSISVNGVHSIQIGNFNASSDGFGSITVFDLSGGGGGGPDPEEPEDTLIASITIQAEPTHTVKLTTDEELWSDVELTITINDSRDLSNSNILIKAYSINEEDQIIEYVLEELITLDNLKGWSYEEVEEDEYINKILTKTFSVDRIYNTGEYRWSTDYKVQPR